MRLINFRRRNGNARSEILTRVTGNRDRNQREGFRIIAMNEKLNVAARWIIFRWPTQRFIIGLIREGRGGGGGGICEQLKFEEIILYATFLIYKSEESGQVSAKRTEIFLPLPTNDLYLEPIRFVSLLIWFSTVPKLRDLSRRLAPSCVHNFNRISVGFAMLENSGTSNSGSLVSLQPSSIILDFSSRNFV